MVVIQIRRFLCVECGRTTTVAPRETLTGRLFSASAIGWAFALFGLLGLSSSQIRARVSPWTVVGPTSAARWDSLFRWIRDWRDGRLWPGPRPASGRRRATAGRAASFLAAHALPSPEPPTVDILAFLGAARAG